MTIQVYLGALRRWLGSGRRAQRILQEVAAHLEDAAEHWRARGFSTPDAEQRAIERFGAPSRVAVDFFRRTPWMLWERIEPFLLAASTVVTLTFAGAATFFTTRAMIVEGSNAFSFVQLLLSAGFACVVVLIWIALARRRTTWVRMARTAGPWVLAVGLVGIGLAAWHGAASKDWEYYLFVMNGNIAAMGALMIRCFSMQPGAASEVSEPD